MPANTKSRSRSKSPKTKSTSVRMTEEDKAAQPEKYILNPASDKHVLRTGATGKKLVKGETVTKTLGKNELLLASTLLFQTTFELTDAAIKEMYEKSDIVLPRSFPKKFGGAGKSTGSKNPDKPKRARSAYIYYGMEHRARIKEEALKEYGLDENGKPKIPNSAPKGNPDNIETITSLIGAEWKACKDTSKYDALAAEDKARYDAEMKVWVVDHPEDIPKSKSPKKPSKTTGYRIYCRDEREEIEADCGLTGKALTSHIAERWNDLDEDEQKPYCDLADKENVGWEERLAEFEASSPHSSPSKRKRSKSPKKISAAEQRKIDDPENYILNTDSDRMVKRDSKAGKKAIKELGGEVSDDGEVTVTSLYGTETPDLAEDDDDLLLEEDN